MRTRNTTSYLTGSETGLAAVGGAGIELIRDKPKREEGRKIAGILFDQAI
jgi:hypothetical protein